MDEKITSVTCEICGKEFQRITPMHLRTHGITIKEYKMKFPDSPLVSYTATGRKVATLFEEQENKSIKTETINDDDNEDTIIDELDFDNIPDHDVVETYKDTDVGQVDFCSLQKDGVLEILKKFFSNVKKDFLIREKNFNGAILYECITDFADPVLKIDIEFPNAFWHNQEPWQNSVREQKLKSFGWTIINIMSNAPTFEEINKIISELNL